MFYQRLNSPLKELNSETQGQNRCPYPTIAFALNQSILAPAARRIGKHTYTGSVCVAYPLAKILYIYLKTPCIRCVRK